MENNKGKACENPEEDCVVQTERVLAGFVWLIHSLSHPEVIGELSHLVHWWKMLKIVQQLPELQDNEYLCARWENSYWTWKCTIKSDNHTRKHISRTVDPGLWLCLQLLQELLNLGVMSLCVCA